jgi:hypothetical protein
MELRGEGVRLLVEPAEDHVDGRPPGLVFQVTDEDQGQAALVLEREDVLRVFRHLGDWLITTGTRQ